MRAVFWFHPAMWWLISRVQLAREEVVDALAVGLTGRRRAYVQALLAFADGMPLVPAPAFARRRHLFRRMVLISREDVMTARRLVTSSVAMILLVALGGWYAVAAFPLREPGAAQVVRKESGPLEQAANPITPENPMPRRMHHEPAEYPAEAAAANASVSVTLTLTIDANGTVAEARPTGLTLKTEDFSVSLTSGSLMNLDQFLDKATVRARPGAATQYVGVTARPIIDAVINAAGSAVQRWQYDPPANAPVSFGTTFFFAPGSPVTDAPAAVPPARTVNTGLRVGGNVKTPAKIRDVRPVYPPDAREQGIQGVVIAEVTIDEAGRVSDARILRSIPMLDQAAIEAVRQWEFEPTLLNGQPTAVIMTVTINFRLD